MAEQRLLAEWFPEFAEHLDKMQAMNASVQGGQPAAALATYNSLPDELKADKFCMTDRTC